MTFDLTSVEVLCVTQPKDHCVQVPWKYIKVCGYSDLFCKKLNQRSLTPRWPSTPHLLRSHVWLNPRIIVSKSHENTSKYVDTVTLFAKTYILRTTCTHRMSDHIVSFLNYVQARQKWADFIQAPGLPPSMGHPSGGSTNSPPFCYSQNLDRWRHLLGMLMSFRRVANIAYPTWDHTKKWLGSWAGGAYIHSCAVILK